MPQGAPKAWEYVVAWLVGIAVAVGPWAAIRYVPVEVNTWASIYIAGAIGGLGLEILLGRGRLELPSPQPMTAEEAAADERRPIGPLVDVGFFARIAVAGIAAVAVLLVYHALVEDTRTLEAFDELANDPVTFGWGVLLGLSSPAVSTAARRLVEARLAAVTTANESRLDTLQASLKAAEEALGRVAEKLGVETPPGTQVLDTFTTIENVVGEAAAAEPGDVDVPRLSRDLLEQLPGGAAGPAAAGAPPVSSEDVAAVHEALGIIKTSIRQVGQGRASSEA